MTIINKVNLDLDKKKEHVSKIVREKRNALLLETDIYGLSDFVMTEEMKQYRQALRDITEHENFPFISDEEWPVDPSKPKEPEVEPFVYDENYVIEDSESANTVAGE